MRRMAPTSGGGVLSSVVAIVEHEADVLAM